MASNKRCRSPDCSDQESRSRTCTQPAPACRGRSSRPLAALTCYDGYIRVAASDMHKDVSSKIAQVARHEPSPPTLLVIGHLSIHTALMAVAMARRFVLATEDRHILPFDLSLQPAFRDPLQASDGAKDKPSLALFLHRCRPHEAQLSRQAGKQVELRVSSSDLPTDLAATLVRRVRAGADISLLATGKEAPSIALLALAHTRVLLAKAELDIRCQPAHVHILEAGRELDGLRFYLMIESC